MVDYSLHYLRWFQYAMELFPLWIIVSFSFVGTGQWPPLVEFLIVILLAPLLAVILNRVGGTVLVYAAAPFIFFLAFYLGFEWTYALLMALFLTIRMENRMAKADHENEETILIITFFGAIAAYLITISPSEGFAIYFVFIFVAQLIFFILGRMVYFYLRDAESMNQSKGKKVTIISLSGLALLASTYLLYVLFPYVKWVLQFVLYLVARFTVWTLAPLFNFLEDYEPEPPEVENEGGGGQVEEGEFEFDENSGNEMVSDIILWVFLTIVVIGAIIAYRIYRKKLGLTSTQVREQYGDDMTKEKTKGRFFWKKKDRAKAPKNKVRKAYYDVEKWAANNDLGRYQSETIEEWHRRLDIHNQIEPQVLEVYKNIRYRDSEHLNYNYEYYMEKINELKEIIRKNHDV